MSTLLEQSKPSAPEPKSKLSKPKVRNRSRHRAFQEHYRELAYRVRILQSAAETSPYVLGVTSCGHGAGVSTVAANLALALAKSVVGRCLLVDTNGKSASLHRTFGVSLSPGFVDFVGGNCPQSDCVYQVKAVDDLHFVPAGKLQENLRARDPVVIAEGLSRLKQDFDVVVLDLPPCNVPGDGLPMASAVDGVLLVIAAERIDRQEADRAVHSLSDVGANLLGCVFNKHREYVPGWISRLI